MRKFLPSLALVGLLAVLVAAPQVAGVLTQQDVFAQKKIPVPPPNPNCSPNGTELPAGQNTPSDDDPLQPAWCYALAAGPTTRVSGANDWVDNFGTNIQMQRFNDGDSNYRVFHADSEGRIKIQSFINNNYFQADMVDTSGYHLSGGVQHSPARSFHFENGKLVVEADLAAGNFNAGGADVFYEIDISPASAPTGITVDPLYGYGTFGQKSANPNAPVAGAIGCRLQIESVGSAVVGESVCAQYDNTSRDAGGTDVTCFPGPCVFGNGSPGRVWETQGAGNGVIASKNDVKDPTGYFRTCLDNAPDEFCKDRFRLELTKDSVRLYVNGFLQREITGLYASNPATGRDNRVPDSWFGSNGVYVYLTDWVNGGQHHTQRFKWGRVAVNPHLSDGSPAPPTVADSFCHNQPLYTCGSGGGNATNTPTPAATATLTPTPTKTPPPNSTSTPVVTATPNVQIQLVRNVNFDDLSPPNKNLRGKYPSDLVDWGPSGWYLSGPYGKDATQSVSFDKAGPTSAKFTFVGAHKLLQLDAINDGTTTSTVSVSCAGQLTTQLKVPPRSIATLKANWTDNCSTVTLSSTNGWLTNFDNFQVK